MITFKNYFCSTLLNKHAFLYHWKWTLELSKRGKYPLYLAWVLLTGLWLSLQKKKNSCVQKSHRKRHIKWQKQIIHQFQTKTIICEDFTKQRDSCLGLWSNESHGLQFFFFFKLNSQTLVIRMIYIFLVFGGCPHRRDIFSTFEEKFMARTHF